MHISEAEELGWVLQILERLFGTVFSCADTKCLLVLPACLSLGTKLKALAAVVDPRETVSLWEGVVPCLLGSQLLGSVQLC